MKPNYEEMSVTALRQYVLSNRDDLEAMRILFHHPALKTKIMPPLFTSEGKPIAENIQAAEEEIKNRIARENSHQPKQE
jgi:hypothetical protein